MLPPFWCVGGEHRSSPGAPGCIEGENGSKKSGPEPRLQAKDLAAALEHRFPTGFDVLSGGNLDCRKVTTDG